MQERRAVAPRPPARRADDEAWKTQLAKHFVDGGYRMRAARARDRDARRATARTTATEARVRRRVVAARAAACGGVPALAPERAAAAAAAHRTRSRSTRRRRRAAAWCRPRCTSARTSAVRRARADRRAEPRAAARACSTRGTTTSRRSACRTTSSTCRARRQTNTLMLATLGRLGEALCDRAVEHDLARQDRARSTRRLRVRRAARSPSLDEFAARFDVLHRTFLGYPLRLAPGGPRREVLRALRRGRRASHDEGAADARRDRVGRGLHGLVRHPEVELY